MALPVSTLHNVEPRDRRVAAWLRRGFLVLLLVFVATGLAGFLGDTQATTRATGGGYELQLRHATTARAGLDVPWEVIVRHPGGFTGDTLTLAVTGRYFDIYETQGFHPEPSASTRDGSTLYLTFDTPPGDTFIVAYDAYIQPSSQIGSSGHLALVEQGGAVVALDFSTTLLP